MFMGIKAAGAYLWTLRDAMQPKMSRDAAAKKLNTVRSQIENIENGNNETHARRYIAYARLVGGDLNEVADLLLSETATADDGKAKARERIEGRAKTIANQVPSEQLPDAIAWVRQLRANPEALKELRRALNDPDALDGIQQH